MSLPLAYFLTWRTYGTWLHGDERGSIDLQHNQLGTPMLPPDPLREQSDRGRMTQPPFTLNVTQRPVVEQAIRDHCVIRKWTLHALNARSTHVHVVVDCRGTHTPELAMAQFKHWATRRLRESGLVARDRQLWVDHGSTRWLNHAAGFIEAVNYVNLDQ